MIWIEATAAESRARPSPTLALFPVVLADPSDGSVPELPGVDAPASFSSDTD
jgi:hypothetical protein